MVWISAVEIEAAQHRNRTKVWLPLIHATTQDGRKTLQHILCHTRDLLEKASRGTKPRRNGKVFHAIGQGCICFGCHAGMLGDVKI